MKKKYIVLDLLAAACLAGQHYVKVFAARKIGFVRWLNFNGAKLKEAVPVDTVKYVMLAAAVLLAAAALTRLIRNRSRAGVNDLVMAAVMAVATVYYAYVTVTMNYDASKASFLIVPMVGLGVFLLIARVMSGASAAE